MNHDTSSAANAPSAPFLLTRSVPPEQLPAEILQALQARERDKKAFDALATELVAAMRPEMERLLTDLVREGLRKVWKTRSDVPTSPESPQ